MSIHAEEREVWSASSVVGISRIGGLVVMVAGKGARWEGAGEEWKEQSGTGREKMRPGKRCGRGSVSGTENQGRN